MANISMTRAQLEALKRNRSTRETLLWAIPKGETDQLHETLMIARAGLTDADIEKVKAAASADGWHSFRVSYFVPGEMPDFAKAVNI